MKATHGRTAFHTATACIAASLLWMAVLLAVPATGAGQASITATVTVLPPGQLLAISSVRQGNVDVYPGGGATPVLVFRLDNHFLLPKSITGVTLRDASRGPGTPSQRLGNIDSVALYLDFDGDFWVSPGDSLLARAAFSTPSVNLAFAPVALAPESGRTFIAAITPSLFPRDRDSLDLFFYRDGDLVTADGTVPVGADSINSFGYNIVDGMTAAQVAFTPTGRSTISPADGLVPVFAVDIPRNGYAPDTLLVFSVVNQGTAPRTSIDSMILFVDNGNGTWGGSAEETRLGRLFFTGGLWSLSGLNRVISSQTARFFLAVDLADYPVNATTLNFGIAQNGIQMRSANDGPIDAAVPAPDTLVVQSLEAVTVTDLPVPARILVPGRSTPPVLSLELRNSYASDVALDSLRLRLVATDPGATQAQLDGQFDSLLLYLDQDGNPSVLGPADVPLASGVLSAGAAIFRTPGLITSGGGGEARLAVTAFVNGAGAKNGNQINFAVSGPGDLFTSPAASPAGTFPIQNDADHRIDIFPAGRVAVAAVPAATLFGGMTEQPALQFRLPSNGYAQDTLLSLQLVTGGTFAGAPSFVTAKLWQDVSGNGYTIDDVVLGSLVHNGSAWRVDNLAVPVPFAGLSLAVTIDVANVQFDGGTLRFGIPQNGVVYRSGADGPDDQSLFNSESHLILPPNRVTAIPIASPSVTAAPGSEGNVLLTFALYNGYLTQTKRLSGMRFTNTSRTRSSPSWADAELGQVSLVLDSDGDRSLDGDSLLATGTFGAGQLHLSGLNVDLPPESIAYFYVVSALPLAAVDADSLEVAIASAADFEFTSAVVMNGDLPLRNGGFVVVDGSVRAQYEVLPVAPGTVRPGDNDVTLFAFRPAANGDRADTLHSLTVSNLGDAGSGDVTALRAWLDVNGDGAWQATDSLLGSLVNFGSDWTRGALDLPVGPAPPSILITGNVSPAAAPNRIFRAAVPVNGCQYASGNDGPRDLPVGGDATFTIFASGLRVAQAPLAAGYTVGQTIAVRATVKNLLATAMDSVVGAILYIDDSSRVVLDSAQAGPTALGPGRSTEFVWYYRAAAQGTTFWRLRALAPNVPDSSAAVQTGAVRIEDTAGAVFVRLVNSMPNAVTRGQTNVFPLSISYMHPDTAAGVASVRLDSVRIAVEDAGGTPLAASSVFSRIALFAASAPVSVVTSVPAQSSLWLKFIDPVDVAPGAGETYSLLVDIAPSATASSFVLGLASAASIPLADANTGIGVPIAGGVNFPLRTAPCAVVDPSRSMAVSYRPLLRPTVNFGQTNVAAMRLIVRHPGLPGSSQIQLSSLRLAVRNAVGSGVLASNLFSDFSIAQGATTIGQLPPAGFATSTVDVPLSLPVTLSPGQVESLSVVMTIKTNASEPGFQIAIADSSHFTVRDLSSGSPIQAASDTVLASGLVFPMLSGWTSLQAPALSPEVCIASALPAGILAGVDSLALVSVVLTQPGGSDTSGTRVASVGVTARDSLGNMLHPDRLFDRLGVRVGGGAILYQPFVDVASGAAIFRLTDTSLYLRPGATVSVDLVGDIEADVPYSHFALTVSTGGAFDVADAVDPSRNPGLVARNGCAAFPFQTAYTQVFLPAGRPTLAPAVLPLQAAFPGQTGLEMFTGTLSYINTIPQADLALRSLRGEVYRRTSDGAVPATASALFDGVRLLANGVTVAADTTLAGGNIDLTLPVDFGVASGATVDLGIQVDIRADAPTGNYLLRFGDSTFVDVRETNQFLRVFPLLAGGPYPVWSTEITLQAGNLENSFSNYPNPFVPSRGEITTLAYVLEEDARINVELFTTTGLAVANLATEEFRAAGAYNDLTWGGQNGRGFQVAPGAYICRFTAHYLSGRVATVTRRIAVVR